MATPIIQHSCLGQCRRGSLTSVSPLPGTLWKVAHQLHVHPSVATSSISDAVVSIACTCTPTGRLGQPSA